MTRWLSHTFASRNTSKPVSRGQTPHTLWPHELEAVVTGKVCDSAEPQVVQNTMSIHRWTRIFAFDGFKRISQCKIHLLHLISPCSYHMFNECPMVTWLVKFLTHTHTHTHAHITSAQWIETTESSLTHTFSCSGAVQDVAFFTTVDHLLTEQVRRLRIQNTYMFVCRLTTTSYCYKRQQNK